MCLYVLKCLLPYIGTQLCRQGGNLFLRGIQLPAQLADLRMTSNSMKRKAYIYTYIYVSRTCSLKAGSAKHINASSNKRGRLPDRSSDMFRFGDEMAKSIKEHTQVFRGTRARYEVSHNTVTRVSRSNREKLPVFQQVQQLRTEN